MRLRNGLLAILVVAAFPATASATDFTGEVSANTPKFAWEGVGSGVPLSALGIITDEAGQANPFGCGTPGHDCDYVKLNVVHPGDVTLTIDFSEGGESAEGIVSYPDLDGSFYKAGPDGQPEGESLTGTDCGTGAVVETCVAKDVQPGAYLVEISFFLADESAYKADVTLATLVPPGVVAAPEPPKAEEPAPPPSSQPAPAAEPQPAAQPQPASKPAAKKKKVSKKKACQKKAKKIKNKKKRKKALKKCSKIKR